MIAYESTDQRPIEELLPEFDSPENIREYYDLRDDIEVHTKEGEAELLRSMREKHPELNGRLDEAHRYVTDLYRQHVAHQEMQDEVAEQVSDAEMNKEKSFIRRHPFLTAAAGIAAIIALLYFTGPLAQTAGEYGASLIESFKAVLGKIGLATPEVSVSAAGAVPVTGELVGPEAAELAGQAFISPGEAAMQNAGAAEAMKAASGVSGVPAGKLSKAAAEVMRSPEAAKALQKAAEGTNITDPLQRIFRNLPPKQ